MLVRSFSLTRTLIALLCLGIWVLGLLGCGPDSRVLPVDAGGSPLVDAGQAVPPDDALVGARLSPADAVLSPGDRLQLSVLLDWASGRATEATSVAEFASADPSIVAVASGGLAIAVQPGRTTVSATAYGYTIAADLTVTEATARALSVSPASLALEVGGSTLLSAVAAMSDGTSRDVSTLVQYSSSDPSRVRVGADGRVTAVGAGDSLIRAEYQTVRTEVSVRVRESAPTSLSATPAALSLQVGQSAPLSIRARYASGEERDVTRESAFSVDNSAIATVSSDGVVRAIAAGQATVTVVSGGALVEATVTVLAPHVVSLAVSPASASVVKAEELPFVATATYSNGQVATVTGSASWSVDDPSVGTISAAGVFTAIKVGATTVRATLGAQSGFTSVSVTAPTVVLLSLSPNPVTVSPGNTAPIVATARMSNGTSQDVTSQCAWTSSDSAVAVGGASVVLGVTVGTSILTCTAQGRSATTTVVVVASDPVLSVSPASVDFGTAYRLTAKVATFTATNGGPNAVTLGTISNAGLGLSENFTYAGGTCATGKVLLAGESCTIGVAAAALVDGTSQKSLTIPYNYAAKSPATASLSMVVPALALSAGPVAFHTCTTAPTGLKCWGYNSAGQLGLGDTQSRGDDGDAPRLWTARLGPRDLRDDLRRSRGVPTHVRALLRRRREVLGGQYQWRTRGRRHERPRRRTE